MKKTLLLGTALVVGVAGFAQSTAKKAVNPKYLKTHSMLKSVHIADSKPAVIESKPASATTAKKRNQNSVSSACNNQLPFTNSFNANGVGGGVTTTEQNCLSYNPDLNKIVWTQRGSNTWTSQITTSGFIQASIIDPVSLAKDSVILYTEGTDHARYPGGAFLNPVGNTNLQKAFGVGMGVVTDGTNWIGMAYTAKPYSSMSAVSHTKATPDSLYQIGSGGPFGFDVGGLAYNGVPDVDIQALGSGSTNKGTVVAIGTIGDKGQLGTNQQPGYKGVFAKATIDNTGKNVNWTFDTTSLMPNLHKGTLGYNLSGSPRMAFGPDGLHGYAVFLGISSTVAHNYSDSSITPILFATTDGGATWTQKLAGYDWMGQHPEAEKNVGNVAGKYSGYSFDPYLHGCDITVDANNVLHFVTCVDLAYSLPGAGGVTTVDSLGIFSALYQYDYKNYHPIIWDFMTDGTCWSTMMVDSIISAACSSDNTDTTYTHSSFAGTATLPVTSHITIGRSADGTKVFYGWADSDPGVTGVPYDIQPDILMKAYDVSTGMVTATKNSTNLGYCFYPYISDISYYDGTNWVVPAVYTVGHDIANHTNQTTYESTTQADYFFSNCGTFANSEFNTAAKVNAGTSNCRVSIEQYNNAFAAAIGNYPNPFNNTTTIAVTLSESKNLNVKVYNAIGSLVFNKSVNGNVGENTVTFDGSALSSGVYYYTVTAGNEQATKKMIIQK